MFDELFEKWWEEGNYEYYYKSSKQIAKFAWGAATQAERKRNLGIAKRVGNLHLSRSEWLSCSEKIYSEVLKDD